MKIQWVPRHEVRLTRQSRGLGPASRSKPLISNVRHRKSGMQDAKQSRRFCIAPLGYSDAGCPSFGGQRTVGGSRSMCRSCELKYRGSVQRVSINRASLCPALGSASGGGVRPAEGCEFSLCFASQPSHSSAMRRSARQSKSGRAATSFARGGGFGLLASTATQRTMHAGWVPQSALPNPSIERTAFGSLSSQTLGLFGNEYLAQ